MRLPGRAEISSAIKQHEAVLAEKRSEQPTILDVDMQNTRQESQPTAPSKSPQGRLHKAEKRLGKNTIIGTGWKQATAPSEKESSD